MNVKAKMQLVTVVHVMAVEDQMAIGRAWTLLEQHVVGVGVAMAMRISAIHQVATLTKSVTAKNWNALLVNPNLAMMGR